MVSVARPVVVLIAADARDEDLVVELIQPPLIDVAADARVAAEFQAAVVLYIVLHEKAVIVWLIARERVDGNGHIEFSSLNEKRLSVYERPFGIAGVGSSFIEVLEGLIEIVATVFFDVRLEIDRCFRVLDQLVAVLVCHADLSEVVPCHVDMTVAARCGMRIGDSLDLAAGDRRSGACRVRIDDEVALKIGHTVSILPQKDFALSLLVVDKGCGISVEVLEYAGLGRSVHMCCDARAGHSAHLAVSVVRRDGRNQICRICRRAVEQTAHDKSSQMQAACTSKICFHHGTSL